MEREINRLKDLLQEKDRLIEHSQLRLDNAASMTKIELKDTRLKRDEALARVEQLEHTLEEEKIR